MKFPKDRVIINSKIKEFLENKDYYAILKMKDEILDKAGVLDEYSYNTLIKVAFVLGDFDRAIVIFSSLFQQDIENYILLYYGFLCMLANTDIYQAKSYINKSELLKDPAVQEYFLKDGANYSNIKHLSKIDINYTLTLILINFIEGISKEVTGDIEIDNEYILFRFFDLINMLYELNYPDEIINELTIALKIIFNLEV